MSRTLWSNLDDPFGRTPSDGVRAGSLPTPRNECDLCGRKVHQKDARELQLPMCGYHIVCETCYFILNPRAGEGYGMIEDIEPIRPMPRRLFRAAMSILHSDIDPDIFEQVLLDAGFRWVTDDL